MLFGIRVIDMTRAINKASVTRALRLNPNCEGQRYSSILHARKRFNNIRANNLYPVLSSEIGRKFENKDWSPFLNIAETCAKCQDSGTCFFDQMQSKKCRIQSQVGEPGRQHVFQNSLGTSSAPHCLLFFNCTSAPRSSKNVTRLQFTSIARKRRLGSSGRSVVGLTAHYTRSKYAANVSARCSVLTIFECVLLLPIRILPLCHQATWLYQYELDV